MLRSISHEFQTDYVGLSQIPQNLINLPGYISELSELNAVWLQPPFQTPQEAKPFTVSFSHVKPHVCSFLGLKGEDQLETLDTGNINIPS